MRGNEISYALICINNHVLSCLISMLSLNPFDFVEVKWLNSHIFYEFMWMQELRWSMDTNYLEGEE